MRIANLSGRLVLITGGRAVDVEKASEGRFESHPQAIYDRWAEFRSWAAAAGLPDGAEFDAADLGAPAPAPRQLLAAGLNYRDHAGAAAARRPHRLGDRAGRRHRSPRLPGRRVRRVAARGGPDGGPGPVRA